MHRHRRLPRLLPTAMFVILIWPGVIWAQESVQLAQTLYSSASYDEALAVLERLQQRQPMADEVRAINQQRALCLLALGRTQEAELAIAAVVQADPAFRPDDSSVSPRVRVAFRDVRSRLLPDIVRNQYADARRQYDGKSWTDAAAAFRRVVALAVDPDLGEAGLAAVADIRTLSDDFAKLAAAAAAAPAPTPAPVEPPTPAIDYDRVYTPGDPSVVAPVTVRQVMPRWTNPSLLIPRAGGTIEVVIGKNGYVETATITQPMATFFDRQVLDSTKNWRYEAASLNGHPVRYRKAIRINFQ
jgi:hypothetical protein